MIKATLVDKASGKPFARVSFSRPEQIAAYMTDTVDVKEGWDDEIQMLNEEVVNRKLMSNQRNQLLDSVAWTIRADSPLTAKNQAEWLVYMKKLQRLTLDQPNGDVVWPDEPKLEYAP